MRTNDLYFHNFRQFGKVFNCFQACFTKKMSKKPQLKTTIVGMVFWQDVKFNFYQYWRTFWEYWTFWWNFTNCFATFSKNTRFLIKRFSAEFSKLRSTCPKERFGGEKFESKCINQSFSDFEQEIIGVWATVFGSAVNTAFYMVRGTICFEVVFFRKLALSKKSYRTLGEKFRVLWKLQSACSEKHAREKAFVF